MHRVENVEVRAGFDQNPGVSRLTEPCRLVKGRTVVQSSRVEVGPYLDEKGHGLRVVTAGGIREDPVFFRIPRSGNSRMFAEDGSRIAKTPLQHGDGEPIRCSQALIGAAEREEIDDIVEAASNRVGEGRLSSNGRQVDVRTVVEQDLDGITAPSASRDVERSLIQGPRATVDLGTIREEPLYRQEPVGPIVPVEYVMKGHDGLSSRMSVRVVSSSNGTIAPSATTSPPRLVPRPSGS